MNFEKDLYSLQSKVENLVTNFTTVNSSIEDKLKESKNIYKIKKDLKRLKFINDLPRVLETQLNEYLNNNNDNYDRDNKIKVLEKSLTYYEKCKDFLNLHKQNSLVKEIYARTSELIFKYRNCIQDEIHMMYIHDFTETHLEKFNLCLSLLVKIEEDKSELILTFLDRYKFLLNKKFDEIFGISKNVSEISFNMYNKIFDNYEFAINENEFLFYENQIENESDINNVNSNNLNNVISVNNNLDIKNLSSKFFKKGTFIWICKKINENIINSFLQMTYKSFIILFDKKSAEKLNSMFNYVIDTFYKKLNDIFEKSKSEHNNNLNDFNNFYQPDPIFYKEGILSFYIPFCEILQNINDDNIISINLVEKIVKNNQNLTKIYINNLELLCVIKISELIQNGVANMSELNKNENDNNYITQINFNNFHLENQNTFNKIITIIIENLQILKKLELGELFGTTPEEINKIYFHKIISFLNIFYVILKSVNLLKNNSTIDNTSNNKKIKEIFTSITKERIYTKIILCKFPLLNLTKNLVEKILKDFPLIKNNKIMFNDLKSYIDKMTNDTLICLFDSLIQFIDKQIYKNLHKLFYSPDWINYEKAISFRIELRNLCYDLFNFKNEIYELLSEEKKNYEENNSSSLNEALLWNKKQRRLSKYQKEMECLHIRRLSIYSSVCESPQIIMMTISKIFLKNINEFIKLKKFNKLAFQQIQLDLNLIKYFFRENLIIDVENILDGFFLEIMKNCSFNSINPESYDESLITGLLEENRKEFSKLLQQNNINN